MPTPPIPDPTPAQLRAAGQAWYETADPSLTAADVQALTALLTAPTLYVALCRAYGVDPDHPGRWEFAGDTFRYAEAARAAAHQAATGPETTP
jgi:hypothetical protein